ncbi:MAG: ABC transporter ATP-binding protein [Anaerolineaceae bacterium]|nr:ABC transporter ATP-binding protein [Anaerolineaceae bacterium]
MIQAESVSVSYGIHLALKKISFEVPSGGILGVVGPNGSGKTTLIRALSGVLPLLTGHIRVEGEDISRLAPLERARRVAVIPQALNLPPAFTVWETVLLGRTPHLNWLGQLSEHDRQIARQAMERTNTFELADRFIGELSGGEQQRVLLARALAQAARVLLMDEPTAHLDLRHQLNWLREIRSLAHHDGFTVLMVLHDLNLVARFADRVALLVEGHLQPPGIPEEILTAESLSNVYRIPLKTVLIGEEKHPIILPAGY